MTSTFPTVIIVEKTTEIKSVTSTFTYTGAADSNNFKTNGAVFSRMMRNFTQTTTPLMMFGFKWSKTNTTGVLFNDFRNLTITATAGERWT